MIVAYYNILDEVLLVKHTMIFIIITNTNIAIITGLVMATCLPTTKALLLASLVLMSLGKMISPTNVVLKIELKYSFNIFPML